MTIKFLIFISSFIVLVFSRSVVNAQTLQELLRDDENGYIPEGVCKNVALAGAVSVRVIVRDNNEVLLVGARGNRVVWKKRFPLKEEVNRPKTSPACEGRKIELYSQAPFSAFTTVQVFSWDGVNLRYVSTRHEDISAEFFEKAIKAAETGHTRTIKKLFSDDKEEGNIDMLYPQRYVNGFTLANAIKRGHASATRLFKEGKPREAASRLALMFDVTVELSNYVGGESESKTVPEKWLEAWKTQELETKDYVTALNDYGYFLQQAGDDGQATTIFKTVIERNPKRAVVHLNLADSLWTLGQKDKARAEYKIYRELMSVENKSEHIPARVVERLR